MPAIAEKSQDWLDEAHAKWAESNLTEEEAVLDLESIKEELRALELKDTKSFKDRVRSAKLRYEQALRLLPHRGGTFRVME